MLALGEFKTTFDELSWVYIYFKVSWQLPFSVQTATYILVSLQVPFGELIATFWWDDTDSYLCWADFCLLATEQPPFNELTAPFGELAAPFWWADYMLDNFHRDWDHTAILSNASDRY